MASSAVLLKPNVFNILLLNFCEQKFLQHGPITIAIDCNALSLLIFVEKCLNYASGPKSAANSDSVWVRQLFNVCVRVFCAPNATILLVYRRVATHKMSFIWKDNFFFFAKIDICCKSIAGPLPSVVEAYTQPYSFSEWIKLIICQIRHELSVIIHVTITGWKKRALGRGPIIITIPYVQAIGFSKSSLEVTCFCGFNHSIYSPDFRWCNNPLL